MKKIISFTFLICIISFATAQQVTMYPTNWFVGMKLNKVQLLLRSTDPSFSKAKFEVKYPGVTLTKTHSFTNGKYVALDLTIAPTAKAGNVKINASIAGKVTVFDWALLNRREGNGTKFAQGVRSEDAVYSQDVGPYSFQKEGKYKLWNRLGKIFGVSGKNASPYWALKKNETFTNLK